VAELLKIAVAGVTQARWDCPVCGMKYVILAHGWRDQVIRCQGCDHDISVKFDPFTTFEDVSK